MSGYRENRREEQFVDPVPPGEGEPSEPRYRRGATDLVVSLAANGRTVRLFTADGEATSRGYDSVDRLGDGLEENASDR